MTSLENQLLTIPKGQDVFSYREALCLGETIDSLRGMCRSGALVRLCRGFYVVGATYAAATHVGRHLLHARAAVRAQDGEVALCGPSGAALHGLDLHDQDLSVVHLLRLDGGSSHRTSGVHHHRGLRPGADQLELIAGIPTVSAAQAVWEVACRSTLEGGVVTADHALHRDPTIRAAVVELADRFAHVPGSARGRLALRLAREKSESAGESITRVQCYRFGIPEPELQHDVLGARGQVIARTDFWWEDFRHVGEFDGKLKYGRLLKEGETAAQAVIREKQREDAVRGEACGMSRFMWASVMPTSARRTMAELAHTMNRSRRLYVTGVELSG